MDNLKLEINPSYHYNEITKKFNPHCDIIVSYGGANVNLDDTSCTRYFNHKVVKSYLDVNLKQGKTYNFKIVVKYKGEVAIASQDLLFDPVVVYNARNQTIAPPFPNKQKAKALSSTLAYKSFDISNPNIQDGQVYYTDKIRLTKHDFVNKYYKDYRCIFDKLGMNHSATFVVKPPTIRLIHVMSDGDRMMNYITPHTRYYDVADRLNKYEDDDYLYLLLDNKYFFYKNAGKYYFKRFLENYNTAPFDITYPISTNFQFQKYRIKNNNRTDERINNRKRFWNVSRLSMNIYEDTFKVLCLRDAILYLINNTYDNGRGVYRIRFKTNHRVSAWKYFFFIRKHYDRTIRDITKTRPRN